MQFTNLAAALALFTAVIPAALASLPTTLELLVFQDGRRVGCVNGYGRFVANDLGCYPFRAQAVDGDEPEENRKLWAVGYGTCSAEAGVLECFEPAGPPSSFRAREFLISFPHAHSLSPLPPCPVPALAPTASSVVLKES